MRPLLTLTFLVSACATAPHGGRARPEPVRVVSHSLNRSPVDVYLLCGDRDAMWLGTIQERGAAAFEIPAARAHCVRGLNFFLVVRNRGWGYWVGPLRPRAGEEVDLVIEKYAGLSSARLRTLR